MKAMTACADPKIGVNNECEVRRRLFDWAKRLRTLWGADFMAHVSTVAMTCPVPACPSHGR